MKHHYGFFLLQKPTVEISKHQTMNVQHQAWWGCHENRYDEKKTMFIVIFLRFEMGRDIFLYLQIIKPCIWDLKAWCVFKHLVSTPNLPCYFNRRGVGFDFISIEICCFIRCCDSKSMTKSIFSKHHIQYGVFFVVFHCHELI